MVNSHQSYCTSLCVYVCVLMLVYVHMCISKIQIMYQVKFHTFWDVITAYQYMPTLIIKSYFWIWCVCVHIRVRL